MPVTQKRYHFLTPLLLNVCFWISKINTTQELVINAEFQGPLQTYLIRTCIQTQSTGHFYAHYSLVNGL